MRTFKRVLSLVLALTIATVAMGCSKEAAKTDASTTAATAAAATSGATSAATSAATTAATTATAQPITYKLYTHYSTDDEKIPVDYALAKLKVAMPNVTIEVEPQANDNGEAIKARIAVGDVPDFFNVNVNQIEIAKEAGSILVLDEMLKSTGLDKKYLPSVADKQLFYTDGHCYALPTVGSQADLIFYNKALFTEYNVAIPTNYEELLAAVKTFRAAGLDTFPIFAKESWPIGAYFDMFLQRVHPEGMLGINNGLYKASDPEVADAIKKAAELIKAGCFQKGATTYDYDAARAMFESGKTPMFINGEWEINDATKALGADCDFLDIFPTADTAGKNDYIMPGAAEIGGLAISATIKDPTQAVQVVANLVQFLSEANYVKVGRIDTAFSVEGLKTEMELPAMTLKLLDKKEGYLLPSTVTHALPNNEFSTGFGELLQQLVAGMDADQFIAKVDKLYLDSK